MVDVGKEKAPMKILILEKLPNMGKLATELKESKEEEVVECLDAI
jgi:hypothetical protein